MPTENQFKNYVRVQMSGRYNMIVEARDAAAEAGLDLDTYFRIIDHYKELSLKYS